MVNLIILSDVSCRLPPLRTHTNILLLWVLARIIKYINSPILVLLSSSRHHITSAIWYIKGDRNINHFIFFVDRVFTRTFPFQYQPAKTSIHSRVYELSKIWMKTILLIFLLWKVGNVCVWRATKRIVSQCMWVVGGGT